MLLQSTVEGAPVSFQLDTLGNTVQIDTTCNSGIDISMRQGLLESMVGKRMLQHWGGGNATYDNIGCKDKLTFDQAAGTITIETDPDISMNQFKVVLILNLLVQQ